jgi:Zn-dependent alcohol dehydrogenase
MLPAKMGAEFTGTSSVKVQVDPLRATFFCPEPQPYLFASR